MRRFGTRHVSRVSRVSRISRIAGVGGLVALASLVKLGASCSFIVERKSQQCQTDADCASFPNAACDVATGACVDEACKANDCVCNPTTSNDYLNGCPRGTCVPFDNGRVKALVDGKLPAAPVGTGGSPAPTFACMTTTSTGTGSGTGGGSPDAGGVQTCEDLPSPLYLMGPTSIQPLLGWVASLYASSSTTVVFQGEPSCTSITDIYNAPFMDNSPGNEEYTTYYDAAGAQHPCRFVSSTVSIDISVSDVFPQTCGFNLNNTDTSVLDTAGPVQAMGFVVPKGSMETSISAEAAYMAFGFGNDSRVSPWNDADYMLVRDDTSGTQQMIAATLGLDAKYFQGADAPGTPALAELVACSPKPESTIGILAVDLAESGLYGVNLLSYQHYDQSCGYLPDSVSGANDKQNVRDGHYFIWGPVHLLTRQDHPNAKASLMINYVSGISPPPEDQPIDIFQIWSQAHLIPQCAMHVTRSTDGGPISAYSPSPSCSCRYDKATNAANAASCVACTSSSACPASAPVCSPFGYCEGS